MNTKMNVFHDKHKFLVWIPEADIEIKVYFNTTFADPDIERTWVGTHIYCRIGDQATEFTTTDLATLFHTCYHPALKILRVIIEAERRAIADKTPQVVSFRRWPEPTAYVGPAVLGRPGETWVEAMPDGQVVWHNEGISRIGGMYQRIYQEE